MRGGRGVDQYRFGCTKDLWEDAFRCIGEKREFSDHYTAGRKDCAADGMLQAESCGYGAYGSLRDEGIYDGREKEPACAS